MVHPWLEYNPSVEVIHFSANQTLYFNLNLYRKRPKHSAENSPEIGKPQRACAQEAREPPNVAMTFSNQKHTAQQLLSPQRSEFLAPMSDPAFNALFIVIKYFYYDPTRVILVLCIIYMLNLCMLGVF